MTSSGRPRSSESMETGPECIPCLLRHARDLARNNLPGPDREIFYMAVMDRLSRFDRKNPPPLFAGEMYRVLERMAGIPDPYAGQKDSSNRRALRLVSRLEKVISSFPVMVWQIWTAWLPLKIPGYPLYFGTPST